MWKLYPGDRFHDAMMLALCAALGVNIKKSRSEQSHSWQKNVPNRCFFTWFTKGKVTVMREYFLNNGWKVSVENGETTYSKGCYIFEVSDMRLNTRYNVGRPIKQKMAA